MVARNLEEMGINLISIVKRLMANDTLINLLYYTDKDPLSHSPLSEQQKETEIFHKLIKIVPRVGPKETAKSVVSITVEKGQKISSNTDFRAIKLSMEILVPLTQWLIKDTNLRPFAIMSQIEKSLDNKKINGLGNISGGDFNINFISEEMSSYTQDFWITDYV